MFEHRKRLHHWPIKFISLIVPRRLRAEWRQEWEAELSHHESLLEIWRRNDRRDRFELLRHSLGSLRDALWLQPKRLEDEMFQDLRFGFRMLLRQRAFTAAAVIALALGIGASTAVFSVVNGVLLQPLPFNQPQRVVALSERNPKLFHDTVGASFPNFADWREQNQVFDAIAAFRSQPMNLTGGGEPLRVTGQAVSAGFFGVLGMNAALGQTFLREDETSRRKAVVLSHGFWQNRFGGNASVVGQTLTLDNAPYTVVGVMPAGFRFPNETDLWILLDLPSPLRQIRGAHFLQAIGRLKSGVSLEQARAGMNAVAGNIARSNPGNAGWSVDVTPLHERLVGPVRRMLLILMGAVGLVLLIACANVAGLLLARSVGRRQEVAVRSALGAGPVRIIRQLLTESLLLSLLGGALGLLLARWGVQALRVMNPPNLPRLEEIGIDGAVLVFALLVSMLTAVVFGLAPAWQASRISFHEALKQSGPTGTWRSRSLDSIVIAEIALSLVLLVGAGLLIRSFLTLMSVDPGFQPLNLVSMQLELPQYKYKQDAQQPDFFQQLLERAAALPDVEAAALTSALPLSANDSKNSFSIEGRDTKEDTWASLRMATPDYFHTMGISLRRGRPFTAQDDSQVPRVLIINEAMARQYWPGEDAIGKRIHFGDESVTIVGVIGNVRHESLEAKVEPEMYVPLRQSPSPVMTLVARVRSSAANAVPALRALVASIDEDQPIENIRTMEEWMSRSVGQRRAVMALLSLFSMLALVLAAVGIYGVMARRVTERTHEIGIRMALGARPRDVLRLLLSQGMRLTLIAVGLGLAAALALTRVMKSFLFNVSTTDPATFVSISLLLVCVALTAIYIPSLRATKVDPLRALRRD